jgi:hypothetical protein
MALIKGELEEVWQCLGWDGNEGPCPGKLPQKVAYCVLGCESLVVLNPYTDWYWGCKKYKKKLKDTEGKILKCKPCLLDIFYIRRDSTMGDIKPATTLRKLLKPPFHHDDVPGIGMIYDGNTRLIDIRGWGFFQYYKNGEQLQDEFKEFVVQSLNEKWEREKPHNPEEPVKCISCKHIVEWKPGYYRCKNRDIDGSIH